MRFFSPTDYPTQPGVHAFLMPMRTRRVEMRVVYLPHGSATVQEGGNIIRTPWLEMPKGAWLPLPEGEFLPEPFVTGSMEDERGPMAVLQAMVDLGHNLGLTPKGATDRLAEIAALRNHLDDMRILAGVKLAPKT